ncbi:energy-coupling factor transporter transmembrane component T family protein [Furfurilactobacillus siliginis]|uniref:Energy-coupling factor transporter transmembrane protein EcfT n=1 Tax=Furfurilactobacillus siliginis TaxID=348151 RepID=A0A0R2L219_9LACO|nr:energy-coupling factor transporter transmembrane component T [Furfurilactobacillus siliginis]KRN95682.1 ABC transporter permease [Furfurilactobacillus siliginis]GEK28056.1 energy-coupling factor transporter transmembrane protein EcfT [Furfurilactobacillus siliginis]
MLEQLTLGRYVPGQSILHRLDSRAKLLLSLYLIVIVFLTSNWLTYVFMFILVGGLIAMTGLKVGYFIRGIGPLIWLIVFTAVLQLLFTPGGHVYWHWGVLMLTSTGIATAVSVFLRFLLIITMATILTLTTAPLAIADGVEAMLKPLRIVHFPVAQTALMLSVALRFVPTLLDEATTIMNAQRARGVEFNNGGLIKRLRAIVPLLIPLFVGAISRADELATAMEARGYQGGDGRTKYRVLHWRSADTMAVISVLIINIVLVVFRHLN